MQYVEHIGVLVHEANQAINNNDFNQLAHIFKLSQKTLRKLTVSHDQ